MPTRPKPHNHAKQHALQQQQRQQYEAQPARREDRAFYASSRWRAFRQYILRRRPTCECDECRAKGIVREAQHVHHVRARKSHPELAFVEGNVQALSHACHSRIEAQRRGGGHV